MTNPTAQPPVGLDALPPHADAVDDATSDALLGCSLEYTYSTGSRYRLDFDLEHRLTFEQLGLPAGAAPPAPVLPYRIRELRPDQLLVHWIVPAAAIHVALVIDLAERRIHVSAMMPPNRWEFFDTGVITAVVRADVRPDGASDVTAQLRPDPPPSD